MTTTSITELLRGKTVLLDGGMGTSLIARGLEGGGCCELWNVERPEIVREIHTAYVDAEHSDHEAYVAGNSDERAFVIPLKKSL